MWTSTCQSIQTAAVMVTEPRVAAAILAAVVLPELKAVERRELAVAEPLVAREPAAAIPEVKTAATT